jgi:mono/diheme cytochrome c family protein
MGGRAEVVSKTRDGAKVLLRGELWDAESSDELSVGETVWVTGFERMRLLKRATRFVVLLIVSGFFSLVSCSKQEKQKETGDMAGHGMAADWKFTLLAGDPAAGRKVFVEVECYKCHQVKGETFPAVADSDKGAGPELSQMAGMHPLEFFAESIVNPNAVIDPEAKKLGYLGDDGKSKMPDYSDVLTIKQVTDLATYLASLRGKEQKSH